MVLLLLNELLAESISTILGKNVKILYKSLIRMESRGDKVDNKVLVSNCVICYSYAYSYIKNIMVQVNSL